MKIIYGNKKEKRCSTKYPSWYDVESATNTGGMVSKIDSALERPLEPPEIEYDKLPDMDEYVILELDDVVIDIDSNGNIEFENTDWAEPQGDEGKDGKFYSYEIGYMELVLTTKEDVIDYAKDILMPHLPLKEGKYKLINCDIMLSFDITNIQVYDADTSSSYEYITDEIEVDLNVGNSYVENLEYEEI